MTDREPLGSRFPGNAERAPRDLVLEDYALKVGQDVVIELLVRAGQGSTGPRLVEGTVADATPVVLVLEHVTTRRVIRVPWHAVATIGNTLTAHPADL